jgi:hypothetical protein
LRPKSSGKVIVPLVDSAVNEGAFSPIRGILKFLFSSDLELVAEEFMSCDHNWVIDKNSAKTKSSFFIVLYLINYLFRLIKHNKMKYVH